MTNRLSVVRVFGLILAILAVVAVVIGWRFKSDLERATTRSALGSTLIATRCAPIEVQQSGTGLPLLVVHGSGGGHDQGMAFAGALAQHGIRVIAMSRFGYLRTPMPADASAAAQADAHVCLLDAFWASSARPCWAARRARLQRCRWPFATPTASARWCCWYRWPTTRRCRPTPHHRCRPGWSTRRSGCIAGAKFIGFDQGGHTWVGHDDEVMAEIGQCLAPLPRP